jgi:Cu2+-exporting ATPase
MNDCCEGPAFVAALGATVAGARRESVLEVEGASCGACVARIESALRTLPGVSEAGFNLATRRARVVHDPGQVTAEALAAAIAKAGYRARLPAQRTDPHRERRRSLWRMGVAGLAMMQIMMFAFPVYIADEGTLPWDVERLFAVASLALTLPVLLFSAAPIWRGAWHGLRAGAPTMDLPVALGIGAAFVASLPATFTGGAVYYEAVAMFVFFLSAGRYFEARALAATVDATEALAELLPRRAVRLEGAGREDVDPAALQPGDRVWIAAGEAAPADCTLTSGATDFNEALLTGESAPARKRAGDTILAGSVNLDAPVEARVERAGEEQTLSFVRRLVERAAADKPRAAQLADRVAAHFVVAVIALAVLAGVAWSFIDPSRALGVAIAVLVVSCPCALSLAAPVALTACASALARQGVLVTRGRAIETLAAVDRVVLDKTGTLTTGRMRISTIDVLGPEPRERCIALAASLERAMPHPLAHALVAAAPAGVGTPSEMRAVPGAGVEALIDGTPYRVGSPDFCAALAASATPFDLGGGAPLAALARPGEWLAVFHFDDTIRPEAPAMVRQLRELGCEVTLLSGDRPPVVDRVARSARITDAVGSADPARKIVVLDALARRGETVLMVGDGVNDAPVLARAHAGMALAQGAAVARSQADFILLNPSLLAIPAAIATARLARRVVAQNLAWAAAYNALTLPLALAGVLTPWMASLGMSLSSLLVVANALRLARQSRPAGASEPFVPVAS